MNEQSRVIEQIQEVQNKFYADNDKTYFYKQYQKAKCMAEINKQIALRDLINHTMYIIPGTNKVFFDYTVFKTYATPENYNDIVSNVLVLFRKCIDLYQSFEIHVNLKSFSVTAATKYKTIINTFCGECLKSDTEFGVLVTNMFIYNVPSMIDQISSMLRPFIHPNLRDKIIMYKKEETEYQLQLLFQK